MPTSSLLRSKKHSAFLSFSLIVILASLLAPAATWAQSFSNSGTITIPNGSGSITPVSGQYPTSGTCTNAACINVSGLEGSYISMSITLTYSNVNTQSFADPALLLVSPDGTHLLDILSYGCGVNQTGNITFALEDSSGNGLFPGTSQCPDPLASTYQAAHYPTDPPSSDNFPSPGPGSSGYTISGNGTNGTGTGTFANVFGSLTGGAANASGSLNGTWRLYAVDQGDASGNTEITSWSLTFNVAGANQSTTTSLASGNPNPAFTSSPGNAVTLTATVTYDGGIAVSGGTVSFYDDGTPISCSGGSQAVSSGTATCVASFSTEGVHPLYAVYNGETGYATSQSTNVNQTVVNHATKTVNGSVTSFCNSGAINLVSAAAGNPYPSMIVLGPTNISGDTEPTVSGTIESVSVTLNSINLTNYEELDNLGVVLQAPGSNTTNFTSTGNAFEFLSFAGNPYTSGSLTFSDTGSAEIPYDQSPSCTDNTCLPTDDWVDIGSDNPDTFPSPGPVSFDKAAPTGSSTFATEFGGGGVNGTWSLYVDNRLAIDGSPGSVGSWCLNFTTQTGANPTTTTVSGSPNPATITSGSTATVSLTADVKSTGYTVNAGTVTFVDGTTSLGSATVSGGAATLNNVTLSEGTHQITASYGGTNSGTIFGISSGRFDQRVDKATTVTGSGSTISYCNTGAITAPGLGEDSGAAYPYPSNIFVSSLPGTVKATSITLNGFNTKDQGDLMSLLVGPSSNSNQWNNNFDFFSLTGSSVSVPSTFNLTFADGGTGVGGNNLETTGTYAPESNEKYTFPQCGQNASDCGAENVGPPLGSTSTFTPTNLANGATYFGNAGQEGVFGGTSSSTYNGNGTWSLYLDDGGPLGGGEATNVTSGWCMNFTENPVTITPTLGHSGTGESGDFVQGEQGASITVNVENDGTGSAGDPAGTNPLTVTDTLNSAFTYSGSSGTAWSCNAASQTVTCTNDASSIAQGSSYPALTINVNVAPNASTSSPLPNSITVSGADVNGATAGDSITVVPTPVLSVGLTDSGTFIQGGNTGQWNVTVSNIAASDSITTGTVTVSDTLPTGYTLYNYSGTGWSCSGTTTVTCTSTQGINGGSSFPAVALMVSVPATSPTSVADTASAYGGGDTTHINAGTAALSNTDTASVAQVPYAIVINGGNNQSAQVTTAFATPLAVTVNDAAGNSIAGQSVTFTAPGSGASGTFPSSSNTVNRTTSPGGAASTMLTANTVVGSYSVTATAGTATNSFSLANTAGLPATVNIFSGSGQSTFIGASFANPLAVEVLDSWANVVSGVTVTFTAPTSGASATLSSPGSCTTNTNGQCSVTATANSTAGGPYSVSASASGASSANFSLTNNSPPNFVVNNTGDAGSGASDCPQNPTGSGPGSCTLRDAVSAAEALGSGNITFDSSVFSSPLTINLGSNAGGTGSTLAFSGVVNIQGPGAGQLTIAGDSDMNMGSVVTVGSGAQVSISGLTISGGYPSSGSGGGIGNQGTLTLSNSAVSSNNINSGSNGAGIDNSGTLTLISSTVSGNSIIPAGGSGGGGGGIFSSGTLTLIDSTVTGNSVGFYSGSGGGGILIGGGTATMIGSTVSGNSAAQLCPIPTYCMGGSGGGINNAGTFTLSNSIVAGNSAGADSDVSGAFAAASANNLVGDGTGMSGISNGSNSNQVGTSGSPINPQLAAPGGSGPTETMLPLPGSPAICAGSASTAVAAGISADQRGVALNAGGYCASGSIDIGAVQTDYALSFSGEPGTPQLSGVAFPAAVTLTEDGSVFTAASETIPLAITSGTIASLTGNSASTAAGIANYSLTATNPTAVTGLKLSASLTLNPEITPTAPAIAATSTPFDLNEPTPTSITLTFTPAGTTWYYGYPPAATLQVSPSNATGSLSHLALSTGSLVPVRNNGGGNYTLELTNGLFTIGKHTIDFTFTGTGDYASSSGSITVTVQAVPGYVVNTASDDAPGTPANCTSKPEGTCTLRDALLAAGAAGAGRITFSSLFATAQTITLGSAGTLGVPANTTIVGPGAARLTVSGAGAVRVFSVGSGLNASISGLTIANGLTTSDPIGGGGLYNAGTLSLSSCVVTGNQDIDVGGGGTGGGLYNDLGASLTINHCTIASNSSTSNFGNSGGGLFNRGTVTVANSTFTGNTAAGGTAGGGQGGAIANANSGTLTLINSTLTGNQVTDPDSVGSSGGAIVNDATLVVENSTIVGNSSPDNVGGINFDSLSGSVTLSNTILAGNTDTGGKPDGYGAIAFTDGGYNLIGNGSGITGITNGTNGDQVGVSANLVPLGNYGGQTQTMIPLPGSAAICAGSASVVPSGTSTDQRGVQFGSSGYCASGSIDVGAVQTDYTMTFTTQPSNVAQNATMKPAPAVTLYENLAAFKASPITIPLTLTSSPTGATLAGGSVATSAGVAKYSALSINQQGTGDTLTATLALNPAITPTPPSLTAISGTFNVTQPPPFGAIDAPEDAVTKSTALEQGDGVIFNGWAADPHDGAPVTQVAILIDGTAAGNATLGIANPGVAAQYGSQYLNSGWTYTSSGLTGGTHTVTAVLSDSLGLTTQLTRTFTVASTALPPYGVLQQAVDAVTKYDPVGRTDGLLVTGWAADEVQGAPVSQVTVYLDGNSVGTATLNLPGPGGEPANSGWSFTDSSLTLGTHTVSVVATDAGGRSATLGTRTIVVQSDAPPFGVINTPQDAVTKSTTVTQGDGVLITGWAADVHDGAPVSSISILIDGTPAGNATLGIANTGIGRLYGSRYLNSGWTYTASALTAGTHTITAVLSDSLGQQTQLTRSFTVSP